MEVFDFLRRVVLLGYVVPAILSLALCLWYVCRARKRGDRFKSGYLDGVLWSVTPFINLVIVILLLSDVIAHFARKTMIKVYSFIDRLV